MVTPVKGTASARPGPSGPTAKPSDLKWRRRSAELTWLNSGVSASSILACVTAPAGTGSPLSWPDGMMLRAVAAKSSACAAQAQASVSTAPRKAPDRTMTLHSKNERWRPVLVGACLLALAAPAQARPPDGWRPDTHAARVYAEHRPGRIAFAVRTEQGFWGRQADTTFPSAS